MHGNGFTWQDVYHMPVYLRMFYYKELEQHYEDQAKAAKKTNQRFKN